MIDCHVHVFDPDRFPYAADTWYRPASGETGTAAQLGHVLDAHWGRQPPALVWVWCVVPWLFAVSLKLISNNGFSDQLISQIKPLKLKNDATVVTSSAAAPTCSLP